MLLAMSGTTAATFKAMEPFSRRFSKLLKNRNLIELLLNQNLLGFDF